MKEFMAPERIYSTGIISFMVSCAIALNRLDS